MSDLTTYDLALTSMEDRVLLYWISKADSDFGDMRFPDTELTFGKLPLDKVWSRFSTVNVSGTKATVGSSFNGKARHTTRGLVYVQFFSTMNMQYEPNALRLLAVGMRDVFRSAPHDASVIYHNARIDELSNDGTFYQCRAIAEYEFDEVM